MNLDFLIEENERRKAARMCAYDPVAGVGCWGERRAVDRSGVEGRMEERDPGAQWVPAGMLADEGYSAAMGSAEWSRLRCRYDFEYWAAVCAKIRHKETHRLSAFVLNGAQRKLLGALESMRQAEMPIRVIVLKARQWGASTMIMYYTAWLQVCVLGNVNSLVCGQVKDTAALIRGMLGMLIDNYPEELWECVDGKGRGPKLSAYCGRQNIRSIDGRGCTVTLGSSESQDSIRGGDYSLAHLSEVAFWKSTAHSSPEMFVRAICGSVLRRKDTLIAFESTANGTGNYFHKEWLRAVAGDSDKRPVFVAWHEIEMYTEEVTDASALWEDMDAYERGLWENHGCTLEAIAWFHAKRREYSSLELMLSEYPTTASEAFSLTDNGVFDVEQCDRLRESCASPERVGEVSGRAQTGEGALEDVKFCDCRNGRMLMWKAPAGRGETSRYVAAVDAGGRSRGSDWSVVTVIDRKGGRDGRTHEVAAQWRGHVDTDVLAWQAAAIAKYYDGAMLVFESNSYEGTHAADSDEYILETIADNYRNLYWREGKDGGLEKPGFHTNRKTKAAAVNTLIAAVRDGGYVERSHEAVDEFTQFQVTDNGGYAARHGCHDDILMTRAIGLYVAREVDERERTASRWRRLAQF